jgi:hypothetical protein
MNHLVEQVTFGGMERQMRYPPPSSRCARGRQRSDDYPINPDTEEPSAPSEI